MANLTAKGQPLTPAQEANAQTLILLGRGLTAPRVAIEACIFDAIFESDLGLSMDWNPTHGGMLGGAQAVFGQYGPANSINVTNQEAQSFYQGGRGYQGGGAIALAATVADPSLLGPQITAPFDADHPPPYGQYLSQTTVPYSGLGLIAQVKREAIAIVGNAGSLSGGGVFGLGGTGTPANAKQVSLWVVGVSSNPDQDYWTTINQYGQNAQWYIFSDGETLVVADGFQIMGQEPRAVIVRWQPTVTSGDVLYDNTAFHGTYSHATQAGGIQRRATLVRTISPTQCEIKVICDIDQFRGGEIVYLKGWGYLGDGLWLIANALRSIFSPVTTLTLVKGMQPLDTNTGLALGPQFATGKAASAPGTVLHALISQAATINNLHLPYEYGGGHAAAGTPDKGDPGGNHVGGYGTVGFDCSGAVGAVLAAAGLWQTGASLPASNTIVDDLIAKGGILAPGQGSGGAECTLFDAPDHIFARINHQFWGTADGVGNIPQGSSGGGWISNGQPGSGFRATHILPSVLGQSATAVASSVS